MDLQDLKEKLVAVLGYGQEGKAVTSYLIKHGIKPVLFDQRPWHEWSAEEQKAIKNLGLNFIFGPDCFEELKGFDVGFRSPGIPLLKISAEGGSAFGGNVKGLKITTSQTKWFFEHCPAKIIGVTGTKGKGTTASLIYEILKCNQPIHRLLNQQPINGLTTGRKIFLTGNIGKIQPLEILDDLTADDYIVYELSSFQLQDLDRSPHIAVVLMTTNEHLDYHKDQKEYIDAKTAITKFQGAADFAVINEDFKNSMAIGKLGIGKKFYFGRAPILDIKNLRLKGAHNLENINAAVSVAKLLNINDEVIRSAVSHFKGLEHRLEFVAEKNGVKFYNDSFSTTPETAIAAINSFEKPEIVIFGGSSKKSDFTELGKAVAKKNNIKAVILVGEEASKIKSAITAGGNFNGKFLEGALSMPDIFNQIKEIAKPGDAVILSPACASFGMFANYKDRGLQFKKFVADYR